MAARMILAQRGRSLGTKYCSSLPRLSTGGISSCQFSTRTYLDSESDPSVDNSSGAPPKRKHPQSFVIPDMNLNLGELETELPKGFHQQGGKGMGKDRHANDGRNSYWRPPWNSPRAEIISAEDFANRPRVTFSESFLTMHDAMVVLSWMSQEDKDGMYKLYIEMMTAIAGQAGANVKKDAWGVMSTNTSHEYVVRVVAQEYNVTTSRAAGVIQLQHNEEQLKRDPTFKVNHALQAEMDGKMREFIREVYQSYGEKDPLQFVEEPLASAGWGGREDTGSNFDVGASELTDVDALLRKTKLDALDEAKVRIDNHIYVEDVDERTRQVKVDSETQKLIKRMEELKALYGGKSSTENKGGEEKSTDDVSAKSASDESVEEGEKSGDEKTAAKSESDDGAEDKDEVTLKFPKFLWTNLPRKGVPKKDTNKVAKTPKEATPYPENNRGHDEVPETRRPRWKYVAQIINTKKLMNPPGSKHRGRKVASRAKAKRHGRVVDGNTIIEEGGKLRVASVAELEQTSWKHVRNESEFMFRGVKDAWLKRQLDQEVDGWGVQKEVYDPGSGKKKELAAGGDEGDAEEKE